MSRRGLGTARMVVALLCAAIVGMLVPVGASASTLPAGFEETTVLPATGSPKPQDIAIAPNGRVFVAEKTGIIRTYDSVDDATATVFADLRTEVHNYGSRGLLSIVVDPGFPAKPYVYVYYTRDAPIGGTTPTYGGTSSFDSCPKYTDPTYGQLDNCPASSRISRLTVAGEVMSGSELPLVTDFCQQYSAHGGGGLAFGKDGMLYASASDGSTSQFWDYGQTGSPKNPCNDPGGSNPTPPTSEAGRLRAQDLETSGDPVGLSGSLIRIDPATGKASDGSTSNAKRIVAYGLRDATRLAIRPGTNDVWVAERGGGYFEELHRIDTFSKQLNFGWPCYENDAPRKQSDLQNLNICEKLYAGNGVNANKAPFWAYDHELPVHPNENCEKDSLGSPAGSTLSGLKFYPAAGGNFPPMYRNALFFADRLRSCIWALMPDANGIPKKGSVIPFAGMAMRATDLEVTPTGDLLYIDQSTDTIKRIRYTVANKAPKAVATANVTSGDAPLQVTFNGLGSSDPDVGDTLTYAWDLDGDNLLDDSTAAQPVFSYTTPGTYTVTLKVTDGSGAFSTATVVIHVTKAADPDPDPTPDPTPNPTPTPQPKTGPQVSVPNTVTPVVKSKPNLLLAAAGIQHVLANKAIIVVGSCNAPCTLKASATVSLPGASRALKLRGVSRSAGSGKQVLLRLKLSGKTLRAVRRALRHGKKVIATVTVIATDTAGASSTAKRKIRLKR